VSTYPNLSLQLLHAVGHLAQCALFAWLQTPIIPASSGTIFYISHWSFHSDVHFKLLCDFMNTLCLY